MKRFLVIRFSSMGDVIIYTSMLNALKWFYGEKIHLTFLTSEEFRSLVDGHKAIDKLLTFDRKKKSTLSLLQMVAAEHEQVPFDQIVDLHGSIRSFLLRSMLYAVPRVVVNKRRIERFFLCKFKVNFLTGKKNNLPISSRVIWDILPKLTLHKMSDEMIEAISDSVNPRMGQLTSIAQFYKAKKDLGQFGISAPFIVIMPSASFEPKRWPVDRFAQVIDNFLTKNKTHQVVVLAGAEDKFCEKLNTQKFSNRFINLQGKTNLQQSFEIISQASFIFGNDTGLLHGAEAMGVPALMIYGPTSPLFGFRPHLKNSSYLSREMFCKPCSQTGSKPCFREKQYCMLEIGVDEISSLLLSRVEGGK